jgi:hypothetical protein
MMQGTGGLLNVVTIPPGATINSPRVVIDGLRGAIFVYKSGAPLGSLIGSWAGTAGTDPYGNIYPQGLDVAAGAITGVVFSGTNFIINSDGIFFYSGTPALGNLIFSWAVNAGTDSFGNNYPAGLGNNTAAGAFSKLNATNLVFGFIFNTVVVINIAGIFIYSPTTGAGNLIASMAGSSGTDANGNAYFQGISMYQVVDGSNVRAVNLNNGKINWYGASTEAGPYTVGMDILAGIFAGALNLWSLADQANNLVFTTQKTLLNGVNRPVVTLTPNSGTVQPFLMSGDPVIGDTTLEVWHDMRALLNGFIGTITGQYPPQYRRTVEGFVEIFGHVQLPAAAGNYNGITFATLPAAYRPGTDVIHWPVTMNQEPSATVLFTPRCEIDTSGNLQFHQMPTSLSSTVICISGRYPLDQMGLILS